MKVWLKSKFTAVNLSVRRERSKVNHLSECLGKLEESRKSKVIRGKTKARLREEVSDTETGNQEANSAK